MNDQVSAIVNGMADPGHSYVVGVGGSNRAFCTGMDMSEADDLFDWSFKANRLQASNQPLMGALGLLTLVFTIWYGGHLAVSGTVTVGELTEFLLYLTMGST